ncbi:MAG: 50S ribosomal protein L18 [Candidatus Omnitrophica bacterium]|nr:50S ribosomal protein L18 [Candidatus Omnitrophota bacterium]
MLVKEAGRIKRHRRIRKKLLGTPERPRLTVHRSAKNIYVQIIDDTKAQTLFSFSTADKKFIQTAPKKGKVAKAEKLGEFFAGNMKEKGIKKVAFDRGGYLYHGRVKALAESLRKNGIEF